MSTTSHDWAAAALPDGTRWWSPSPGDTLMLYDEIFGQRVYEEFADAARSGSLLVDVGANTGLSALFFVRHCPGVPVVAIEPIPITYSCLVQNLWRYAPDALTVQAALGTQRGFASLTYYPRTPSQSGLHADHAKDDELTATYLRNSGFDDVAVAGALRGLHDGVTVRAPRTRLDVLLSEIHPDVDSGIFVKVDVERAELEVLEGAGDKWAAIDGVVCEVEDHGEGVLDAVTDLLRRSGLTTETSQQETLRGSGLWTVIGLRRPAPAVSGSPSTGATATG